MNDSPAEVRFDCECGREVTAPSDTDETTCECGAEYLVSAMQLVSPSPEERP